MVENLLSLGFISLYLIMVLLCVIFKSVFLFTRGILSTYAWMFCCMFGSGGGGGGGEVTLLLSTYVS